MNGLGGMYIYIKVFIILLQILKLLLERYTITMRKHFSTGLETLSKNQERSLIDTWGGLIITLLVIMMII